jgi:hypothetical protein
MKSITLINLFMIFKNHEAYSQLRLENLQIEITCQIVILKKKLVGRIYIMGRRVIKKFNT